MPQLKLRDEELLDIARQVRIHAKVDQTFWREAADWVADEFPADPFKDRADWMQDQQPADNPEIVTHIQAKHAELLFEAFPRCDPKRPTEDLNRDFGSFNLRDAQRVLFLNAILCDSDFDGVAFGIAWPRRSKDGNCLESALTRTVGMKQPAWYDDDPWFRMVQKSVEVLDLECDGWRQPTQSSIAVAATRAGGTIAGIASRTKLPQTLHHLAASMAGKNPIEEKLRDLFAAQSHGPHAGDELMGYLAEQPDGMIAIIKLPKQFHDSDILTVCDADGLIKFGTRNHCFVGSDHELRVENGWDFASITGPNCKPMKQFIDEALSFAGDKRIRQHVRLTDQGRVRASRLNVDRPARQIEQKPKKNETNWRTVQSQLLVMCDMGELYTNLQDLMERTSCRSKSTVSKAITRSKILKAWQARDMHNKSPRVQSLDGFVADNIGYVEEHDLSVGLTEEQVDDEMNRLINDATPDEKAQLNSLNKKQRREMAESAYSQKRDQEPSPLEDDLPCCKPKQVKQIKKL